MPKEFNITGLCNPHKHYMVEPSQKVDKILAFIAEGKYFTINRPRQYGKTTTLFLLANRLRRKDKYVVVEMSFEEVGDSMFTGEKVFCTTFVEMFVDALEYDHEEFAQYVRTLLEMVYNFKTLSKCLSRLFEHINKSIVLIIDEVDQSSNNDLFLRFLGMRRHKYLLRNAEKDRSFQSVILAGVHDVKTLKLKLRPDEEQRLNSPWNIATDFTVDLSFQPVEIANMLKEYAQDKDLNFKIQALSKKNFLLYVWSSVFSE